MQPFTECAILKIWDYATKYKQQLEGI